MTTETTTPTADAILEAVCKALTVDADEVRFLSPIQRTVADDGWVAVANSPNHEQQDWAYGPDAATAAANALAQCTVLQRANDCRVLAVSTDCVATAWDVSQPLNRIYAGSGGGPEAAARGAISAAGPYANDLQVRCTWWPREVPEPPPPGVSLTTHLTT
jgi:hypothetical protein